jgi:hypothetical protein
MQTVNFDKVNLSSPPSTEEIGALGCEIESRQEMRWKLDFKNFD